MYNQVAQDPISSFFYQVYLFFVGTKRVATDPVVIHSVSDAINAYAFFASILSIILISGIIYSYIRIREIWNDRNTRVLIREQDPVEETELHKRWRKIIDKSESSNEDQWKQSVLDADAILDEYTKHLGIVGNTLGERLKNAEFPHVQDAWDAHKIRNKVAHQGDSFHLTQREARKAISLYEKVFKIAQLL